MQNIEDGSAVAAAAIAGNINHTETHTTLSRGITSGRKPKCCISLVRRCASLFRFYERSSAWLSSCSPSVNNEVLPEPETAKNYAFIYDNWLINIPRSIQSDALFQQCKKRL